MCVWVGGLIHVLRKKAFYPVYARDRGTRAFWIAMFILLRGFAIPLYVIFGVIASAKRKPAWWRTALVHTLAAGLFLVSVGALRLPAGSGVLTRDPDTDSFDLPARWGIFIHAGADNSSLTSSRSYSTTSSDDAMFTRSSVYLRAVGDGPLLHETVEALRARLAEVPGIDRIGWGSSEEPLPSREKLFDWYITLAMNEEGSLPLPGIRKTAGKLDVQFGTTPYSQSRHYSDDWTPPLVQVSGSCSIDYTFTFRGLETLNARTRHPGQALGEEVFKQVADVWEGVAEQRGQPIDVPSEWYGDWAEADVPPFPEGTPRGILVSGYAPFTHRETVWCVEPVVAPVAFVDGMRERLLERGWHFEDQDIGSETDVFLRMSRDAELLHFSSVVQDASVGAAAEAPTQVYVHYWNRFTREEVQRLASGWAREGRAMGLMLPLIQHLDKDARAEFMRYLQARPLHTPREALLLARYHHRLDQRDEAVRCLQHADLLSQLESDNTQIHGELKTLRKKLDVASVTLRSATPELLREIGVITLSEEALPLQRETGLGQNLIVRHAPGGTLHVYRIAPADIATAWSFHYACIEEHARSWTASRFTIPEDPEDVSHFVPHGALGEEPPPKVTVAYLGRNLFEFTVALEKSSEGGY
jgi:hypothetical protein